MSKENGSQSQIEQAIAGSARAYASLVLDHFGQLTSLQLESAKTYAETGLQQARAALEVKSASDLQSYLESQQKVAKEMSERIRSDVEKVVSLNQTFAQEAQKATKDSAKEVSKSAEKATKKATQAAEDGSRKDTKDTQAAANTQ